MNITNNNIEPEHTCTEYKCEKKSLLTGREKEILISLAKGLTNNQIGKLLSLSTSTVKNHLSKIYIKLDISNRTQATIYTIQNLPYKEAFVSKTDGRLIN